MNVAWVCSINDSNKNQVSAIMFFYLQFNGCFCVSLCVRLATVSNKYEAHFLASILFLNIFGRVNSNLKCFRQSHGIRHGAAAKPGGADGPGWHNGVGSRDTSGMS